MNIYNMLNRIDSLSAPQSKTQFNFFTTEESINNRFFGKDIDGNTVFAMISPSPFIQAAYQKTSKLVFWFNIKCLFSIDGKIELRTLHVLSCLSVDLDERTAFIRLTMSFTDSMSSQEPNNLNELFTCLTNLFASDKKASKIELQGFYAELFTIKYFAEQGINLCRFWQKKDKMKFDFSLSAIKRIEVKSTIKELRVHHFKHEQLLSDLYDIKIISFKLRNDDMGLSLKKLIEDIQNLAMDSFSTLIYIEKFIKNLSNNELENVKYDIKFIENNIAFYDSIDIPKFSSLQPRGVTQTEYYSDLSTISTLSIEKMISWIKEM